MRRTGTTRRGAFTATGALALGAVLAGCGDGPGHGKDSGRSGAATAAEQASAARAEKRIRAAAARTSLELLGGYEQVIRTHPATAAGLSPLRDAVRAHAEALAPAGGRPPALPRSRAAGLKELAAAERRAADAHLAALMEAPPELARLLASIAAAGAAHVYLLTELAKETSS
ncbi:hypothetical protein ACFV8T_40250 [Streptomyces sp. NPDC059832]|uniref:hypothetical protein n=1 Tax=Streptomyces sp. NPDC059832 TaxID=3346966 RepID=UPI0036684E70